MPDPTIYYEPKLTVIGRMSFDNPIPEWTTDTEVGGEQLAEFAGRLCYLSFGEDVDMGGHKTINGRKSNADYLANIRKQAHGSVLEHATYSILIEQVSRSLTHELVRHRAGMAYSQLSQRYVDESNVAFVIPPAMIGHKELERDFRYMATEAALSYGGFVEDLLPQYEHIEKKTERLKVVREAARAALPNATETKIVMTGNGRSWRHFIWLRGALGVEREMRRLAVETAKILKAEAPNMFADVEIQTGHDGLPFVHVAAGSV